MVSGYSSECGWILWPLLLLALLAGFCPGSDSRSGCRYARFIDSGLLCLTSLFANYDLARTSTTK